MARIVVTVGAIPAQVDSVKFITNRFKGGLALQTAEFLMEHHEVTVVAWEHASILQSPSLRAPFSMMKLVTVRDAYDYYEKVLAIDADCYVMAAAVANIGPAEPWTGKFPSHLYSPGDKFNVEFTILPRVIDAIRKQNPRCSVVGYKLFDGTDEELISAAKLTQSHSRAQIVFANRPETAKTKKTVVTSDGNAWDVDFVEHLLMIDQLANSRYFKTEVLPYEGGTMSPEAQWLSDEYPKYPDPSNGMVYGTFAARDSDDGGFWTTSRGKRGDHTVKVFTVADYNLTIKASDKPTLNAPLLFATLANNHKINYLVHGHEQIGDPFAARYEFPGTLAEMKSAPRLGKDQFVVSLPHHGYLAGFADFEACRTFVEARKQ